MKETVGSLRAYFILAGLGSGALNVVALQHAEPAPAKMIAIVGIAFAIAYVYAGVRLRSLIATTPERVLWLLIAGGLFLALLFGIGLLYGAALAALPKIILGLLITWYLFANVRRLAAESRAAAVAPVHP
jgi:hypothetical protein